jgi:lipid-A-disaccharide synthase-like uncharacterized protein
MLIDLAQVVGGYLRDVFALNFDWWVVLGLVAQAMFTMRFVIQWVASEREGRSVIPVAFWFFSIGGGLLLLGYALYRKDLVFILGQAFGVFVYLRNLYFVLSKGETKASTVKAPAKKRRSRAQGRR